MRALVLIASVCCLCLATTACQAESKSAQGDDEDAIPCPRGASDCNGHCVSLDSDPDNCGECGNDCGEQSCAGGKCVDECPAETASCGAACPDTQSDPAHCGGCFAKCPHLKACDNGECVCEPPFMTCGNACTDVTSDADHCGECDNACDSGVCEDGVCQETSTATGGS